VAGESEEPPREEEEPDATPPRAATTTLGDAPTKLALVPRPEGDASAGDAQRASKAAMTEAGSGEEKEKRSEARERSGKAKEKRGDQPPRSGGFVLWKGRVFFSSPLLFLLTPVLPARHIPIRAARKKGRWKKEMHFPA
jgi:hypothetical protein